MTHTHTQKVLKLMQLVREIRDLRARGQWSRADALRHTAYRLAHELELIYEDARAIAEFLFGATRWHFSTAYAEAREWCLADLGGEVGGVPINQLVLTEAIIRSCRR